MILYTALTEQPIEITGIFFSYQLIIFQKGSLIDKSSTYEKIYCVPIGEWVSIFLQVSMGNYYNSGCPLNYGARLLLELNIYKNIDSTLFSTS